MGVGFCYSKKVNLNLSLFSDSFSRFERRIYIPLPDEIARRYLLIHNMKKTKHSLTEEDFDLIAEKTEG